MHWVHRLLNKHVHLAREGVGALHFCVPRFRATGGRIHFQPEGAETAIELTPEQAEEIVECASAAEALALLSANTY